MTIAASTLLVEDEQTVADSYIKSFEDEGLKVELATTWEEGLAKFRVAGHELVIADYNLPGSRHGLQLLLAMKRLVPHSRMLLISGAMSPRAEGLAKTIEFLDGFHAKRVGLSDTLLLEATQVADHADEPTDWRKFASGYLSDPRAQQAELDEIDNALAADVARRA